MARKRMITRTVQQTTAKVMCLNVETANVTVEEYTIGGEYTELELLKKLQELFETDVLKLVHVESQEVEELLLGMDEDTFIRLATVLPPRTNKQED